MSTVSVLLPVHNAERTILHALASVASADQIVVVDDASTDLTTSILTAIERVLPTITLIRHPYRLGVTAALRTGFQACTGTYVARQDADDYSMPERLALQRDWLDGQHDCVLVASRAIVQANHGGSRLSCWARWMPAAQLWFRNPIVHGSVMFRRDAVERVGGYREPFGLAQDLDLWLRLRKVGRLHILPQALYHRTQHVGQLSISRRTEQRAYAALARWAAL